MISFPTSFILTPQGLTNLALLLLTAAFFILLAQRRPYSLATRWLLGHEASLALFLTAQLLVNATFSPFWYPLQYLGFVIGMTCLLQFAGAFPEPLPATRAMRWLGIFAGLSIAVEIFLVLRFWSAPLSVNALALRTWGIVMGLWQIIAAMHLLARQAKRLDDAKRSGWAALLAPHTQGSRAARNMLLASLAIGGLALSNIVYRVWLLPYISEAVFNIAWNIGLMLLLSLFALTYLVNTPDRVSFQIKLILGTLNAALISIWLLSLIYPSQLQLAYDTAYQADAQVIQAGLERGAMSPAQELPAVTFVLNCQTDSAPEILFTREPNLDAGHICGGNFFPGSTYHQSGSNLFISIKQFAHEGQTYVVGFSYSGYFNTINQFSLPIALVMIGSALIIMLLLPLVFYNNLVQPLGELSNGLRQVNQGRLDVSVPVQANDEIGQLAQAFNAMAAELRKSVAGLEDQVAVAQQAEKSLREQQEQLRALSARLAEVEEAERKKLGRELHDQAGQNLTALSLTLKLIQTQLEANAPTSATLPARLDDAADLVRQITQRIRNVMEDLQPPALEEFGLAAALRWYAERFTARTNIAVEVTSPDPAPRQSPPVEIALFRIAQEALTNVARHARATRVDILIDSTPRLTRMLIRDNGIGFERNESADDRAHWGLRIMAERAEAIGGKCDIISAPEQGAQIIIEVNA